VTPTADGPPLVAQSTVSIDAKGVHMTYSVPLHKRQVVIESCDGELRNVLDATTVRNAGTTYFLIRFKPSGNAVCGSGQRPAVALPADDDHYVRGVAAAVARAAHGTPPEPAAVAARAATPKPAPSAKPSATPTARPTNKPSPAATATASPTRAALQDWVESDGLFWFVRIRNTTGEPLTPSGGVFDCRNVDVGCGPFMHTLLEPGGTATVAAIAATNRNAAPVFAYRYTTSGGTQTISGAGSSTKLVPHHIAPMSAQELRSAQALALAQLRAPAQKSAPLIPARLVKRGSSRLAIGETGTAVVRLTIGEDGTPQEASIVSVTNKALTAAAIETAVSSTYAPATQNGRPVAGKYIATFSFDGQDPSLSSIPVWKRPSSPVPSGSPALPTQSSAAPAQGSAAPALNPSAPELSPEAPAQSSAVPAAAASSPPP
jgi:outer membrane biosynthesis protein TonB